jgi:hypothetical protein
LWTKAREFQCHWQKCSVVCLTITYKWPFYYHTIQKLALQAATSLKIPQQDFKAHNSWAVKFTHHASLATCPRPT